METLYSDLQKLEQFYENGFITAKEYFTIKNRILIIHLRIENTRKEVKEDVRKGRI
ncbi:MAG: hypothetical protein J6T23_06070 [Elusimicrobia bacterium]|nr:hypothetical protein [Elusimicrobiota bacterium]